VHYLDNRAIDITDARCNREDRPRMFENRVLRRRFGPKRDEVTGKWRKLHNEELLLSTPHQILFG
jgi:hypothetical protein